MINISRRFVLCGFFLQCLLIFSDQSLGKTEQSHPHSSVGQKPVKKPANSSVTSEPSGDCHKPCIIYSERNKKRESVIPGRKPRDNVTEVSYYNRGNPETANGEKFCPKTCLKAAHKLLPFGTVVQVTNLENGRSVKVTINDCGPFRDGRALDLTERAFREISPVSKGIIKASMEIIYQPKNPLRYECLKLSA